MAVDSKSRRISARAEKRRDAAEECCKALRTLHAKRVADRVAGDYQVVTDWLLRWMDLGTKAKYDPPKPCHKTGIQGS